MDHDWERIESPPGSSLPTFKCRKTGVLAHQRKRHSHGPPSARIYLYKCGHKGCHAYATTRLPGLTGCGNYKWRCVAHAEEKPDARRKSSG